MRIGLVQNQSNKSFTAVNQDVLKRAVEEHSIMNTVSGDLIEDLQYCILTKRISPQDGIDTIEALRGLTKKKYHDLYNPILDYCKKVLLK